MILLVFPLRTPYCMGISTFIYYLLVFRHDKNEKLINHDNCFCFQPFFVPFLFVVPCLHVSIVTFLFLIIFLMQNIEIQLYLTNINQTFSKFPPQKKSSFRTKTQKKKNIHVQTKCWNQKVLVWPRGFMTLSDKYWSSKRKYCH